MNDKCDKCHGTGYLPKSPPVGVRVPEDFRDAIMSAFLGDTLYEGRYRILAVEGKEIFQPDGSIKTELYIMDWITQTRLVAVDGADRGPRALEKRPKDPTRKANTARGGPGSLAGMSCSLAGIAG